MNRVFRIAALALLFAGIGRSAPAVTVSGQVVDELGFGIFNVDLDFEDDDTGQIIFTPFDNTDAGGFYSVDVPPATYNIRFRSPDPFWLDREIRRVEITGPMTLDTFLWFAQLFTGHVQNTVGAPLAAVDLNFVEVTTGDQFDANDDNTDLAGNFAVFVPGQTYDVLFTPPLGQPYAGLALYGVAVAGTTDVGTIVLPDGIAVTGQVQRPGGSVVAGADTDFEDVATGSTIYTPRDDTDALGNLNVLVPAGTYDVTVKPAAATGLAWQAIHDVVATAPVSLGVVSLQNGVTVSGTAVNGLGVPVVGGDIDLFDRAAGHDLPTADDNTGAGGAFSLFPPLGSTFDLFVKPPPGALLAAVVLRDVHPLGPLNLGQVALPAGHPISGTVRDPLGAPVATVDLDAFELGTGLPYPMVGGDTNASGQYSVRLPAGSWTIVATPPAGSDLLPAAAVIDPLSGPAVLDLVLPSATVGVEELAAVGSVRVRAPAPNPFRAGRETVLAFETDRPLRTVRLTVVDVRGRAVRTVELTGPAGGRHAIPWDGRDGTGARVAAGVYFLRLEAGTEVFARRVTVLR